MNTALLEQKRLSLSPMEQWWFQALTTGQLPNWGSTKPSVCLTADLCDHMRQTVPILREKSDRQLTIVVKEQFGAENYSDGAKRGWSFPPLREARKLWEMKHGKEIWDSPQDNWSSQSAKRDSRTKK